MHVIANIHLNSKHFHLLFLKRFDGSFFGIGLICWKMFYIMRLTLYILIDTQIKNFWICMEGAVLWNISNFVPFFNSTLPQPHKMINDGFWEIVRWAYIRAEADGVLRIFHAPYVAAMCFYSLIFYDPIFFTQF